MKTTIELAREVYGAHTEWTGAPLDRLEQLVALVRADERNKQGEAFQQILSSVKAIARADEREACAKVCEEYDDEYDVHTKQTVEGIALQIRARGNT